MARRKQPLPTRKRITKARRPSSKPKLSKDQKKLKLAIVKTIVDKKEEQEKKHGGKVQHGWIVNHLKEDPDEMYSKYKITPHDVRNEVVRRQKKKAKQQETESEEEEDDDDDEIETPLQATTTPPTKGMPVDKMVRTAYCCLSAGCSPHY